MFLLQLLNIITSFVLALYGFNTMLMTYFCLRPRKRTELAVQPRWGITPRVTVQLPIFNELYVVERLIDAAAALDWPSEQLEIQVLDDSDDETTRIAQARAEWHRRRGINVEVVRRPERTGYKAGALRYGLERSHGDCIAVFDADFIPPAHFLKSTVPYLLADEKIGMVQTRWGHLNADYSPLTRAQAIALDGHFAVEQAARSDRGLLMNFNGSGGIWRRTCIDAVGGWQVDTICEDLDLSYRAQLAGWKLLFLPHVVCPAEIPPQAQAWKRQQARWAQGSTQCLLKFGKKLVSAPVPLFNRLEGFFHLGAYLLQPLSVVLLLVTVPLVANRVTTPTIMALFGLASFGPPVLYAISQRQIYPNWLSRYAYFPVLMLLGIGMSFNNSLGVLHGLSGRQTSFRRTPKFHVEHQKDDWSEKSYALPFSWTVLGELALAVYALTGAVIAWRLDEGWRVAIFLLYAAGFGYTAGLSLWHSLPAGVTKKKAQPVGASR